MATDWAEPFVPIVWSDEEVADYHTTCRGDVGMRMVATEHQQAIVDSMVQCIPRRKWPHSLRSMFFRATNVFHIFHWADAMEHLPQWFVDEYMCDATVQSYPELQQRVAAPVSALRAMRVE